MAINEMRAISTFAEAAALGSLRRAAASQGITPQAASAALVQLEQHLGVRLFHRTTRRLALTQDGQRFLESARPGLEALRSAIRQARQGREEMAGPLRIAAPRASMLELLWPVLEEFCRQYPEVEPDVQLDDRIANWVEDRIDIGFRVGRPPADGLIARRLCAMQMVVCAAPAYLERHGMPESIAALAGHRLSAFRHPTQGRLMPWELRVGEEIVAHPVAPALVTNDVDLEARAVLAGQVIGQLLGVTAAAHLRDGRLVPLLTAHACDHLGMYAYYGNRSAQPARARAFLDLVAERLAGSPALGLTAKELDAAQARWRRKARGKSRARAPA